MSKPKRKLKVIWLAAGVVAAGFAALVFLSMEKNRIEVPRADRPGSRGLTEHVPSAGLAPLDQSVRLGGVLERQGPVDGDLEPFEDVRLPIRKSSG